MNDRKINKYIELIYIDTKKTFLFVATYHL
jgi:hypothetical protein